MKNHHLVRQVVNHVQQTNAKSGRHPHLAWWQLSLIGIGSIIGAGFFLGTGLSISKAGPSILFGYLIGAVTAFLAFGALAEMTIQDPQEGSFRAYAHKAFGPVMGFVSGWMYWLSGVLIMSSEVIALSTFSQFWFPHIPLWAFALAYSLLGFGIISLGVDDFGQTEAIFAVVKTAALVAFIVLGLLLTTGLLSPPGASSGGTNFAHMLPNGVSGLWGALIFVFFSFGGVAVIGVASSELKDQNDIARAGIVMLIILTSVYVLALLFVMRMVAWDSIDASTSPFVTALSVFNVPYLKSVFNAVIISAAFSTMVGALFSITKVMVSLADAGDAPKQIAATNSRGVPVKALLMTGMGLVVVILLSYLLPNTIYEYFTTAAGVMLILNWVTILASQIRLRSEGTQTDGFHLGWYPISSFLGIALILLTVAGAMTSPSERIGVLVSLAMIAVIFAAYRVAFRSGPEA